MKLAGEFSKDLRRELEKKRRFRGKYTWKVNWPLPGVTHDNVDLAGLRQDGSPTLLVEVELKREDPSSNVIKIWKWASHRRPKRGVLFVHAFSKRFEAAKKEAKARAEFAAKRMRKECPQVRYRQVQLDYNVRSGRGSRGAGRRRFWARRLARLVSRLL